MAYEVVFSPQFEGELDEIVSYLVGELESPRAASDLLDRLDEIVGLLETMPESFPLAHDDYLLAQGYRRAMARGYLVFFRVGRDGAVRVGHILHVSQDWQAKI